MLAVNYSTMRDNLKNYCDKATDEAETVIITRKNEKNVVLMSLEQYNALTKAVRNAEYLAKSRQVLDKHQVIYQTAELGKVDAGGGGTIAYILSLYGMQVVDCGVALHSMHAPWETLSKADLYEAYKGYKAFLIEC